MNSTSTVSKAEFARLAGVSPAAISKAIQGSLRAALSDGGINKDHPAAVAYMSRPHRVGRPGRVGVEDLSEFVRSGFRTLEWLGAKLPDSYGPRLKQVDKKLFWLGAFSNAATQAEQTTAIEFVRAELEALDGIVRPQSAPLDGS